MRTRYEGAFVIVEGGNDARTWAKLKHPTKCDPQIAGSKTNVLESQEILDDAGVDGVVSVVDRDFDFLLGGTGPRSGNTFVTDSHDIDVDILLTSALEAMLAEFGDVARVAAFESRCGKRVRGRLFESAAQIGMMKLASIRNSLDINFGKLDYVRQIDTTTLLLNEPALVSECARLAGATPAAFKSLYDQEKQRNYNPSQTCCGHDVHRILAIGLQRTFGRQIHGGYDEGAVASNLRLAFQPTAFRGTSLFQKIREWEARHAPYRILENSL